MLGRRKEIMFEKKETPMVEEMHTLLGRESRFEGKLVFEGIVRIDGKFNGEIHTQGKLVVGESAFVEGKSEVGSLVLNGEFHGDVIASERVEITSTGKLFGTLKTPILVIEEGGAFDGTCEMTRSIKGKTTGESE